MNEHKPRLAMVSIGIRRDLLAPLVYLKRLELVHFYKEAVYGDLTDRDFDSTLRRYVSPLDLYRQLVAAQPDVIQSVEPFSFYTQPFLWACLAAARKTRAALLVVTFENRPLETRFGKPRAALLKWASSLYFARASWVIVLNHGAYENVLTCGTAPNKIVRAMWGTWGVDLTEFYPRKTRPPDAPPTILFVGRLHREKGVFVLIEAFAEVHEKCPTARLIMLGDGPARRELEEQVRARGLADSVELIGTVKNRDVPDFFRRADVFCAPSVTTPKWAEQVGVSALQAMACGVPVVSTHSGAIPEYVPDGVAGILVEENNPTALANALLALLNDTDRAVALGEGGRKYAVARYDARTNIDRAEDFILEKLKSIMTNESKLDWDASWERADTTILERDVWLLTDYIKRDYILQRLPQHARTLEVGCGSAKLTALIAERGARVTGVDLSWPALLAARKNFEALRVAGTLGQADAFQLPFGEGTFDAVLSTGLLEHFRDPLPIVAEMARVLRTGGLFFSDVAPLKFSLLRMGMYMRGMARNVTDEYPYNGREIALWLHAAKLRDIQVIPSGVVPPLGLVRKFPAFREWSFRHQNVWTRLDGTPLAEQLGFFYLAWAVK